MKTPGRARLSLILSAAVLVLGASSLGGCDDQGIESSAAPTARWNPQAFVFPRLVVGSRAERQVRVENIGQGTLKLAHLAGRFASSADDYSLFFVVQGADAADAGAGAAPQQRIAIQRGVNSFPGVVDVPRGSAITFVLEYSASDDTGAGGVIEFETNDPSNRNISIPIRGDEGGAEINVAPRTIDFGRVGAGTEATETVRVSNIGSSVLLIEDIVVNGSPDFTVRVNGVDLAQDASILADPDQDGQPGLSDDTSFELQVVYAPQVDGPDAGQIVIFSTDPQRPQETVELTANGASPCIRVQPETLEFPAALTGRTESRPVAIESCGGQPLEITAVYLRDDSSPVYTVDEGSVPDLPTQLPAFVMDEAPPTRQIVVDFTPEDTAAYGGTLIIESNDPLRPVIEVPIVGRGTLNDCPVAAVGQDTFNVLPLDIIELDGSPSTDADGPDGAPVFYEWTVIERPDGSTAQPVERIQDPRRPADSGVPDNTGTPGAFFFVDLAGRYVISLRVRDNLDLWAPSESCPQPDALITIDARPNEDIHVQMVWDTPGDRDQTDGDGSDVDLHMLHPRGRSWAQAPLDCYYANGNPDWGPAGAAGNPSLDIDDVNGAGPENINLDEPEDTSALGGQYRVGIDYYRAENFGSGGTFGPSEVTVRIFLGGVLAGEWSRVMQSTHHFWEVASIIWTAGDRRATPINRYYNSVP
ncbi:MAG: choice-of-anchor D domain-containing protein [Myxococcales bacterium]|nr:choice-of-anchor D domain-containing protein [Myxococcales bacterium]